MQLIVVLTFFGRVLIQTILHAFLILLLRCSTDQMGSEYNLHLTYTERKTSTGVKFGEPAGHFEGHLLLIHLSSSVLLHILGKCIESVTILLKNQRANQLSNVVRCMIVEHRFVWCCIRKLMELQNLSLIQSALYHNLSFLHGSSLNYSSFSAPDTIVLFVGC